MPEVSSRCSQLPPDRELQVLPLNQAQDIQFKGARADPSPPSIPSPPDFSINIPAHLPARRPSELFVIYVPTEDMAGLTDRMAH